MNRTWNKLSLRKSYPVRSYVKISVKICEIIDRGTTRDKNIPKTKGQQRQETKGHKHELKTRNVEQSNKLNHLVSRKGLLPQWGTFCETMAVSNSLGLPKK